MNNRRLFLLSPLSSFPIFAMADTVAVAKQDLEKTQSITEQIGILVVMIVIVVVLVGMICAFARKI